MNLYEELELQETQRALDSCASEEVSLREPETPTKEQIDIVAKELFDKDFLPKPVHMNKWKTAPDYVKYRYKFYAQLAIETWEKIRNQQ